MRFTLASLIVACLLWPTAAVQAQPPDQRAADAVVQTFVVPRQQLDAWADALRAQFAATESVKIAADQRTGRLVVLAPPTVQQQISLRLANANQGNTETSNLPRIRSVDRSTVRHQVRLTQVNADSLTQRLESIWGGPLPTSLADGERVVSFPAGNGQQVALTIDERRGLVRVEGPYGPATSWAQVVRALDEPARQGDRQTRVMPLRYSDRDQVATALTVLQASAKGEEQAAIQIKRVPAQREGLRWGGDVTRLIFQPADGADAADGDDAAVGAQDGEGGDDPPADADPPADGDPPAEGDRGGVLGEVQIELLEGLDVVVIRGNKRDVERVEAIIRDIERLSAETEPVIDVFKLEHADGEALAPLVTDLYNQFFQPRHGTVSINALVKPNSVLLIGRSEAVEAAREIITRLDEPVEPTTQFRVFPLEFLSAEDAAQTITEFYEERGGLGTRLRVSADFRSNSLVVQGSPRDLEEISQLLRDLDVGESRSVNELRVFRLQNTLADELAPVIQQAINGTIDGQAGQAQQGQQNRQTEQVRSTMLTLTTVDDGRLLKSGILTDVLVTADERANSLVVRAPREAMPLIAALIEQLDQLPSEAQIKVFTIVNGDAASLAETLDELFGQQQQGGPGQAFGAGQGDNSLVPLRFSVDLRTNSIITSGSAADLQVVEAILLRLDESDIRERVTVVYRLKNSPATDVAQAINDFLTSERDVQQLPQGNQGTPFEQIEREVVVVPEPVSNSLIVSASPRYFEEIEEIVEKLDERPPMVLIQVLIAEVQLDDEDEMGVELGIQDSLLFDRSSVVNNMLQPGFNFNNQPLGNDSGAASLATANNLAGQGLTNFNVGRSNMALGYGGLVLSASSESLNVLIRALQDERSMQILSRPQVMTLDNQPAFVQVGARVPRITSSNIVNNAVINNTVLENVGILLGVTPRIAPDGQVVMEIDAEKSELGPEAQGIPISINANGDVIRSPQINIITAQTTVSARSGQTVILGGLITKTSSTTTRRVPYLSDVPVLGNLFRYDNVMEDRRELLFIMTPYVVRDDDDIEFLKQMESSRMSWCLADIVCVHGEHGLLDNSQQSFNGGCGPVIYPDENPTGEVIHHGPTEIINGEHYIPDGELVPAPQPEQMHAPMFEVPELPQPEDPREFSRQDNINGQGDFRVRAVEPAGYYNRGRYQRHGTLRGPSRLPEVQR